MKPLQKRLIIKNLKGNAELEDFIGEKNRLFLETTLRGSDTVVVTGPPRSGKTGFSLEVLEEIGETEGSVIFVVCKTVKNARESLRTYKKHIDPGVPRSTIESENAVLTYFGTSRVCSKAHEDEATHPRNCYEKNTEKEQKIAEEIYGGTEWYGRKNTSDLEICPRNLQDELLHLYLNSDDTAVVFTTYDSLKVLERRFSEEEIFSGNSFLLDEYRFSVEMPVNSKIIGRGREKGKKDNVRKTYNRIFEDWRKEDGSRELMRYLDNLYRELHRALSGQVGEAFGANDVNNPTDYLNHKYSEVEIDKPGGRLWKEAEKLGEWAQERLRIAQRCSRKGVRIVFDFLEKSKGKQLVLKTVESDEGQESRETIQKVLEEREKSVLVDSTPFPEEYHPFVFGKDVELDRIEFDMPYSFRMAVDHTSYSASDIIRNEDDRKRMVNQIKDLREHLDAEPSDAPVFARKKKEAKVLRQEGVEEVSYAFSDETAGVSHGGDYVIVTGKPNIHSKSESFRKIGMRFAPYFYENKDETPEAPDYDELKALMELVQLSFRTAGEDSGAIILNMDGTVGRWGWMEEIEIHRLDAQKDYRDKEKHLTRFVEEGERLRVKSKEEKIQERIIDKLNSKGQMKKTELITSIKGQYDEVKEVVDDMMDSHWISVKEGQHSRTQILSFNY